MRMKTKVGSRHFLIAGVVGIAVLAVPFESEANVGGIAKLVKSISSGANASKVITGTTVVAAAYSSSNAVEAKQARDFSQQELERFESSGVDTRGDAFFSLYMKFDGKKAEMFWADWFSNPDMMTVVEIEGQGSYLIPNVRTNYDARVPILERIVGKSIRPGARIIVAIFDSDDGTNQVLNHLMQTPVRLEGNTNLYFPIPVGVGSVGGSLNADISILGSDVVFNDSDLVAAIEMKAPKADRNGQWATEGRFVTKGGELLGEYSFSQFWSAKGKQELSAAVQKQGGRHVFWWVIAGALGLYFVKRIFLPA